MHASELWQLEAFASTMFDFVNAFAGHRMSTLLGSALDNIFAPLQLEDVAGGIIPRQTDAMSGCADWPFGITTGQVRGVPLRPTG